MRGFFAGLRRARLMRSRLAVLGTIGDWLGSLFGLKRSTVGAGFAPAPRPGMACDGSADAAPRRHAFVIYRLKPADALEPYRHRYMCLDCRWNFLVDVRGRVVAVDAADRPIATDEAMRRLASFAGKSCPGRPRRSGAANPSFIPHSTLERRVPHRAWSAVASRFHPAKNHRAHESR